MKFGRGGGGGKVHVGGGANCCTDGGAIGLVTCACTCT